MDKEIELVNNLFNVVLYIGSGIAAKVWNNENGRKAVRDCMSMHLRKSEFQGIFYQIGRAPSWKLIIDETNNPPELSRKGKMRVKFIINIDCKKNFWSREEELDCRSFTDHEINSLKDLEPGDTIWVLSQSPFHCNWNRFDYRKLQVESTDKSWLGCGGNITVPIFGKSSGYEDDKMAISHNGVARIYINKQDLINELKGFIGEIERLIKKVEESD